MYQYPSREIVLEHGLITMATQSRLLFKGAMLVVEDGDTDAYRAACTECGSISLHRDESRNEIVCEDCGLVTDLSEPIDFSGLSGTGMTRSVLAERREKRHDGRTLKSSICDIIDNSIDAGASEIRVTYRESKFLGKPCAALMVFDNGGGIHPDNMVEALSFNTMRKDGYEWWELGSFGIGLKDSCLAHGNELTLFSKVRDEPFSITRLSGSFTDYKKEWRIIEDEEVKSNLFPTQFRTETFNSALELIQGVEQGTIVLLEDMKPISEDIEQGLEPLESIADFISLVFCDYIQGVDIGPRNASEPLTICFNTDNPLEPLDPFFKSEVGVGILRGVTGTFMKPHKFELTYIGEESPVDMEFTINRYIIPNRAQRGIRDPRNDERMISAVGGGIQDCQGIYFKRNYRILDGPWNGNNWRRKAQMGMSTYNHHTVARWEFILPPQAIIDPDLVPPDKRTVRADVFRTEILNAKNESLLWHVEDETPYGPRTTESDFSRGSIYNRRAESHNNSNDIPRICSEDDCNNRVAYDEEMCEEHRGNHCDRCFEEIENPDISLCDDCQAMVCTDCEENFVENAGEELCLLCRQDPCAADGCEEKSQIATSYCETHESQVCREPQCRNLSVSRFNRCEDHLTIYESDDGLTIRMVRSGLDNEPFQTDGQDFNINLDNQEVSGVLDRLRGEVDGG